MLYTYQCECGKEEIEVRPIVHRDNPLECPVCQQDMKRGIQAPDLFLGGLPREHGVRWEHASGLPLKRSKGTAS